MKQKKPDLILFVGFFFLIASIMVTSLIGMDALGSTSSLFTGSYQASVKRWTDAEQAQRNVLALQNEINILVLAKDAARLESAKETMAALKQEIDTFFSGEGYEDNSDFQNAKNNFYDWEREREQLISLLEVEKYQEAFQITQSAEYKKIDSVVESMDGLIGAEQAQQMAAYEAAAKKADTSYAQLFWLGVSTTLLACMVTVIIRTKQKEYETALFLEKEELRITFASMGDGIISVDLRGNVIKMNPMAEKLTGWSFASAQGKPYSEIFRIRMQGEAGRQPDPVAEVFSGDRIFVTDREMILTAKGGRECIIADSAAPVKNNKGTTVGAVLIFRDVTQQKKSQEQLKISESRLKRAQAIAHVGNWELDIASGQMWASEEALSIYGMPMNMPFLSLEEAQAMVYPSCRPTLDKALEELIRHNVPYNVMFQITRANDSRMRYVHSIAVLEKDAKGNPQKVQGSLQDITEQKLKEEKILYLSHHDSLTGLYNRTFFENELNRLDSPEYLPLSYIIGDVNGLKLVNDTLGHAEGDRLLTGIAGLLTLCCRQGDALARIGGDEFCILLPNTPLETAQEVCKSIYQACADYAEKNNKESFFQSISLGCAAKNEMAETMAVVAKTAEEVMYRRKMLQRKSVHSSIISSIKTTMYEKNHETEEHAERLIELSRALGEAISLPEEKQNELELLSALHDIGKMSIGDHVLNKSGQLTEEEWFEIRKHPEVGYRIAEATPELLPIAEYILCHHERWDGTGYPQGLEEEQIPLLSRIISIVDAYDAMTQDRPYRLALSKEEAIEEILENAGGQFDPILARIFIEQVLRKPETKG